ncbi:MAG: hypothetical protein Q9195_008430 [Heterodermia aff. obscurata]
MDVRAFVRDQFTRLPYPTTKHTGQTIIVTGSNVGLGLEAARHFTRLDAEKVILAVRNVEKGEAAKKSIEETTNRKNVVEVWQLDLASYESVKQFAKKANQLRRLDAIVENAGIATLTFRTSEDNESTITTNVVSTFLLALMILPKLQETATKFNVTPYLTVVSSDVHSWTSFPERNSANIFDTLNNKETANMQERYPISKLLEVFYCRELAERIGKSSKPRVIVNFLNPGLCHSELSREAGWFLTVLKFFFARTTEVGSRTLVTATEGGEATHGKPSKLVRSEEGAKTQVRVYDELSAKLEAIQPGIMSNIG